MMNSWRSAILLCAVLSGAACEGPFSGDRPFSLQTINGPHRLKIVEVAGTNYLAFVNTNKRFAQSAGSLHFYTLTDPADPQLASALSLKLPSQVSDFVIDSTGRLIVADRGKDRLIFFELSGGAWVQQRNADGSEKEFLVTSNPQRLDIFTATGTGKETLLVVSQSSGTPHFVDLATLTFADLPSSSTDSVLFNEKRGANLYMEPRQVTVANRNDPVLGGGERNGFGIYEAIFLPDTSEHQVIVFSSALALGLFGFRYDSFTNDSNYAWDLQQARDGYSDASGNYPGSKGSGFRGLAVDQAGSVFATARDDNGFYMMSSASFMVDKVAVGSETRAIRNTRGYAKNSADNRLLRLDTILTDKIFPKVGALVVDCPPRVGPLTPVCVKGDSSVRTFATRAWTIGLETKKIYRIKAADTVIADDTPFSSSATASESAALDDKPQDILWHPTANLLYVSLTDQSKVVIVGADSLSTVAILGD